MEDRSQELDVGEQKRWIKDDANILALTGSVRVKSDRHYKLNMYNNSWGNYKVVWKKDVDSEEIDPCFQNENFSLKLKISPEKKQKEMKREN